MQDKNKKIGLAALVVALLALSQASAITNAFNYTFHAGSNITIVDDGLGNVTISANGTNGDNQSDATKLNKTGDVVSNTFSLSSIDDYNYIIYNPLYNDIFYSNYNGEYGVSEILMEKTKLSIIQDQQNTNANIILRNGSIEISANNNLSLYATNTNLWSDLNMTGHDITNSRRYSGINNICNLLLPSGYDSFQIECGGDTYMTTNPSGFDITAGDYTLYVHDDVIGFNTPDSYLQATGGGLEIGDSTKADGYACWVGGILVSQTDVCSS